MTSPLIPDGGRDVTFREDVMAVLSKAGCNLGTCHGNARGKGGFQISLRGQDPDGDYRVLRGDWWQRRANVAEPDQSLMLLKPTMQVAHEGGQRFAIGSPEYSILRTWIAAGLPDSRSTVREFVGLDVSTRDLVLEAPVWSHQLHVHARYSDGSRRPIDSLAVFETGAPFLKVSPAGRIEAQGVGETVVLVRYLDQQQPITVAVIPQRPALALEQLSGRNDVDRWINAKLVKLKLPASAVCDDATFVRRAYLDLIGTLPTAEEARSFVTETSPGKRETLIDQLLDRPEYADWWALKWADMLRVEEKTLDPKGATTFHAWLRSWLAQDRPLDELVRELVSAQGSTYDRPATNFYRSLRDPLARSEAVAQLFLGVRLQCARCHNHPFDRWTQDDYYAWGNVFSQVDYKLLDNQRRDSNDSHEFDGEQVVFLDVSRQINDPRTNAPRTPQLLGASSPLQDLQRDRLAALGTWLTAADHDRFAQMLANRVWRHLMGRGLVEPVDDFRATNPPSHPELLQSLANALRSEGFRLKPLIRVIATSEAYQRTSIPNSQNIEDDVNYSHATVRRLTAEQLVDGLAQVTSVDFSFRGYPSRTHARELAGVGALIRRQGGPLSGDEWLRIYGRPQRLQSCECERTEETTLAQVFQLLSSTQIHDMTTRPGNLAEQVSSQSSTHEGISRLYWTCLSRTPHESELTEMVAYVERSPVRLTAFQDILWSLVTSNEFLLRH